MSDGKCIEWLDKGQPVQLLPDSNGIIYQTKVGIPAEGAEAHLGILRINAQHRVTKLNMRRNLQFRRSSFK